MAASSSTITLVAADGFKCSAYVSEPSGAPKGAIVVLQDIQAAVQHAARAGKVGIVGYCWGGLLVWRSAEKVRGLSAAVAYYLSLIHI